MRSEDIALTLAEMMVEHSSLSIFDAGSLEPILARQYPGASPDQIWRAVRIFLELRRADEDFARYGGGHALPGP